MKHIILIHALFMKPFSMKSLGHKISKIDSQIKVHYFGYKSTKYSENVLQNLDNFIKSLNILDTDEVIFIGHSMGGLVGRLFLHYYRPINVKCLITMGTPHRGSALGKFLSKTPFQFILGSSGDSGITETIPEWNNSYPLYCIAGNFPHKLFLNMFNLNMNNLDNDGTVFVQEAILNNSTKNIIIQNIAHMQLLFSDIVFQKIKDIIIK